MKGNIDNELNRIIKPITKDLNLVEKELKKQIQLISRESLLQYDPWLKHPISHFFHVRGKYLRPTMLILSAKALDPHYRLRKSDIIQAAAAIELLHSASLVHDDVIDEADVRRGEQSLNTVYGNKIAVLVGDLLYSRFFSIATHLESVEFPQQIKLFDLFCETTQKMCLGEISEERLLKV